MCVDGNRQFVFEDVGCSMVNVLLYLYSDKLKAILGQFMFVFCQPFRRDKYICGW